MIDLHQGARLAKADAKRKARFLPVGERGRYQSIAMRLVAEIEEQVDGAFAAYATSHGEHLAHDACSYGIVHEAIVSGSGCQPSFGRLG